MKSTGSLKCNQPHYFSTGRAVNMEKLRDVEISSGNAFKIPPCIDEDEFAVKFWKEQREERRQDRKAGYMNNHNYHSRQHLNIAERLRVPEDVELRGKSLTDDIDRDYYTLVAGRRIKVNKKIRDYLRDIRSCFFTKLKIGYCNDEVMKAEQDHVRELEKYNEIKRRFELYLSCFEEFLTEDHSLSLNKLERAKREREMSQEKQIKIEELKNSLRRLEAELMVTEEKWSTLRMYQKFLYDISPSDWRKEHDSDFELQQRSLGMSSIEGLAGSKDADLEVKINRFVEECSRSQPPSLFFTSPEQIQNIFRELEKTNVIALTHCDNLEKPIQKMLAAVMKVREELVGREKTLEEDIAFLRALVEEEERKADTFREDAKSIVFGIYKDFVNEDNLKVVALVEDAYEDAVAKNDYELSMVDMMKEIENKYETLLLSVDLQPYQVVAPTMRGFYKNEKRIEEEAKEAEKKVHQMEILLKRLSQSLTYPKQGFRRPSTRRLVHRSEPKKEALQKYEHLTLPTEEEKEFEHFFGRTCRNVGEAGLCRPLCSVSKTLFPKVPE